VDREENAKDIGEWDHTRVERDLHRFRMACGIRADGFVGRVRELTAGISDLHFLDAAELLEYGLEAPETSTGEGDDLMTSLRIRHHSPHLGIRLGPGLRFAIMGTP
jgi:hypothetical protein